VVDVGLGAKPPAARDWDLRKAPNRWGGKGNWGAEPQHWMIFWNFSIRIRHLRLI